MNFLIGVAFGALIHELILGKAHELMLRKVKLKKEQTNDDRD